MAFIKVNFDDVPDQILPLDPGVYPMTVQEASIEETQKGGQKIVVILKVSDEANPNHGRLLYDHIGLGNQYGQVALKKLLKSCGVTPGPEGFSTDDIVGKTARVRVATRTYQDKETGETKEAASVKEYITEA